MKIYNEYSNTRYIIEYHVQYPEKLDEIHTDLPFLPERMNIEKFEKLVADFHDKEKYVMYIAI